MRWKRLTVALAVLLTLLAGNPAFGNDPGCTVAALSGLYVFAATGYIIPASGPALPKAIVELIRFHGDGTVDRPGVAVSLNGAITVFPVGGTGTYTVAELVPPDEGCTGSVTSSVGPTFYLAFPRYEPEKIWMIQTNANNVFQGTATRLSR